MATQSAGRQRLRGGRRQKKHGQAQDQNDTMSIAPPLAPARQVYIPPEFQLKYPHLCYLNEALQKVYNGQKVPEHISAESLVRNFFRFTLLRDKGLFQHCLKKNLSRLYSLSSQYESWSVAAAAGEFPSGVLPFRLAPSTLLAALCAEGGVSEIQDDSGWPLFEWMLHDQTSWSNTMPLFWKESHFECPDWIQRHVESNNACIFRAPEGIFNHDIDAWFGHKRKTGERCTISPLPFGFPQDWDSCIRKGTVKPPPWIQAALGIPQTPKQHTTGQSSADSDDFNGKNNTAPELGEDVSHDSAPSDRPAQASSHTNEPVGTADAGVDAANALHRGPKRGLDNTFEKGSWDGTQDYALRKWAEIEKFYRREGAFSSAALEDIYRRMDDLHAISAVAKVEAQAVSEEVQTKEEEIEALLQMVKEDKDRVQQLQERFANSKKQQQDCDSLIAKMQEEITKRKMDICRRKRQRLG